MYKMNGRIKPEHCYCMTIGLALLSYSIYLFVLAGQYIDSDKIDSQCQVDNCILTLKKRPDQPWSSNTSYAVITLSVRQSIIIQNKATNNNIGLKWFNVYEGDHNDEALSIYNYYNSNQSHPCVMIFNIRKGKWTIMTFEQPPIELGILTERNGITSDFYATAGAFLFAISFTMLLGTFGNLISEESYEKLPRDNSKDGIDTVEKTNIAL